VRSYQSVVLSFGGPHTIVGRELLSRLRSKATDVLLVEERQKPNADTCLELTALADGAEGLDVRLFLFHR